LQKKKRRMRRLAAVVMVSLVALWSSSNAFMTTPGRRMEKALEVQAANSIKTSSKGGARTLVARKGKGKVSGNLERRWGDIDRRWRLWWYL